MRDLLPYSRFLFTRPSVIEGMARLLDFGNTLDSYQFFQTAEEADAQALYADWCAVGHDMQKAIDRLLKRHHLNSQKKPSDKHSGCRIPHR